MAEQLRAPSQTKRLIQLALALVAWGVVTTVVGFMFARMAVSTMGHSAVLFLYGTWAVGVVGFVATAIYLLTRRRNDRGSAI